MNPGGCAGTPKIILAFNEAAFAKWYDRFIVDTDNAIWIPKYLIDAHAGKIWFGMDKDNTYVRPREADRDKLKV